MKDFKEHALNVAKLNGATDIKAVETALSFMK